MPSMEKTLLQPNAFQQRPDVALSLVLYGEVFHIRIASGLPEEVSTDANSWAPLSDTDSVGRSHVGPQTLFSGLLIVTVRPRLENIRVESDISVLLL